MSEDVRHDPGASPARLDGPVGSDGGPSTVSDISLTYLSDERPRVNRRDALRTGGAGLLAVVALSGCSSGPDETGGDDATGSPAVEAGADTPTGTPAEGTPPESSPTRSGTPSPGVDYAARFREFVESQGIAVSELREAGPIVTLRYATESTSYEAISQDIGGISGGFFRQVRDGWNVTRLEATVTDPAGTPLATWYARAEWFREFQREEITADELSLRVLRTVERTGATGTGTATAGTN